VYRDCKDGVTALTILDTRRPKQNGLYPVKVQVIFKRVQKYYSTGKECLIPNLPNCLKQERVIWQTASAKLQIAEIKDIEISQIPSGESQIQDVPSQKFNNFSLSWSHYCICWLN